MTVTCTPHHREKSKDKEITEKGDDRNKGDRLIEIKEGSTGGPLTVALTDARFGKQKSLIFVY